MQNNIETVITLDENKYKKIKEIAEERRKSVSQLIEQTIDDLVSNLSLHDNDSASKDFVNPLLDIVGICSTGLGDAALNHDKYLYGRDTKWASL